MGIPRVALAGIGWRGSVRHPMAGAWVGNSIHPHFQLKKESSMVTRGFTGRRVGPETAARLPPGQHATQDFPVLSATPTPQIDLAEWKFTLKQGSRPIASWSWLEFNQLPRTVWTGDIHCVTAWSKFDTTWEGVSIDDLLAAAGVGELTP